MTSRHAIAIVAALVAMSPSAAAPEYDDETMLGTWEATGVSETECISSDVAVTLRIFEKIAPGSYRATHVERGELTRKEACREGAGADPADVSPVEIGGGVVQVHVAGDTVTISSGNPDFHTETLKLEGSRMVGADDMGGIEYVKTFPEFRYNAQEGGIGWQAIRFPLCETEQITLNVISECTLYEDFAATFMGMIESAIREAIKSGDTESTIQRSGEFNHLERFDGMTPEEILSASLPEVSAFVTSKIADARKALDECASCSDEEVEKLRDELAKRKAQREAILDVKRQRD
jgi:hypothetical protein